MPDQLLSPRPAATLIPVRDGAHGIEVFMMQRTHKAAFIPGGYVFPGGAVEAGDADAFFAERSVGPDLREANRMTDLEDRGLRYRVAALRECFEEAGLLLAYGEDGRIVDMQGADAGTRFAALRQQVAAGEIPFSEMCRSAGLRLALDRLVYCAHWVTPLGVPRRFDTRFFLCIAPEGQIGSHDNVETIAHMWIRPDDALARHRSGEISMMFATQKTLEMLARFDDASSLLQHAAALPLVPRHAPRVSTGRNGRSVLIAGDHAYAEVGKLDPRGKGTASCEIVPGTPTALSDTVRRIAAPNPSFMTGPGTNSYLVSAGDGIAVIDPGPALEEHVESLLRHAHGEIRWVLTTHTHIDHSPAAMMLKARTGAQVLGMPSPGAGTQDPGYQPDVVLQDGQSLDLGGIVLRVIHTPGHASNHLCYLHESERLLFSGDHIMQGSTVVINPPDGDLSAYLSSLQRLKTMEIEYIAPGHGFLIDRPHEAVDRILAHRRAREAKIIDALRATGCVSSGELLPRVYDDVPAQRLPMAHRSLLAHLAKLASEGRALEERGQWRLAACDGAERDGKVPSV